MITLYIVEQDEEIKWDDCIDHDIILREMNLVDPQTKKEVGCYYQLKNKFQQTASDDPVYIMKTDLADFIENAESIQISQMEVEKSENGDVG